MLFLSHCLKYSLTWVAWLRVSQAHCRQLELDETGTPSPFCPLWVGNPKWAPLRAVFRFLQ